MARVGWQDLRFMILGRDGETMRRGEMRGTRSSFAEASEDWMDAN